MKSIRQKRSNKRLVAIISIATVLVVSGVLFAYTFLGGSNKATDSGKVNDVDYSAPTDDQIETGKNIKEESIENDPEISNDQKPTTNSAPQTASDLSTSITAASIEDDVLYVRNEINGIYEQGSCKLSLTKQSSVITRNSGIQALPKDSTCKGFNIPAAELSPGTWQIELTVTVNGEVAHASGQVKV